MKTDIDEIEEAHIKALQLAKDIAIKIYEEDTAHCSYDHIANLLRLNCTDKENYIFVFDLLFNSRQQAVFIKRVLQYKLSQEEIVLMVHLIGYYNELDRLKTSKHAIYRACSQILKDKIIDLSK